MSSALTVGRPTDTLFATLFVAGAILVGLMLLLAAPLGRSLLPNGGFHFFASVAHLIYHKPAQQMRYLLAVALVFGLACLFAATHVPGRSLTELTRRRMGKVMVRLLALSGRFAVVGIAVWAWCSQIHEVTGQPPTIFFGTGNLVVALIFTLGVIVIAWLCVVRLERREPTLLRRIDTLPRWPWLAIAAVLTAVWLLPSVFRTQNLAPASLSVTYHLQFTFDDFVALLNGRTPLVDYAEQYASVLPFLVWPALRLGGADVGTFTALMCLLSFGALMAVQRTIALVICNERRALALYVPFLATSLFFILRSGSQLFSWGSYYAVFPMRYFGPYVLLWLCVRHLRGRRPRSAVTVFVFAGLTLLNNIEFGLPAFVAAVAAIAMGGRPATGRVVRSLRHALVGLAVALASISVLTLVRAGSLPSLDLWTLYSRLFGEGGFGLLPTPAGGFYLVMYMTFAGALLTAARRFHDDIVDRTYTAGLAYCGVFGLATGGYYMGRTNPAGLVVLFSIWALTVVLLVPLAWRVIVARPSPRGSLLLAAGVMVSFGLTVTAVAQLPAPWAQIRRISTSASPPAPYDVSAAVAFVRRTARRGEPIVLLIPLGHLVAIDAAVEDVSLYSHPDGVDTYEQLDSLLRALRSADGTQFYVGRDSFPEIPRVLTREKFSSVTTDPASGIRLWRRRHSAVSSTHVVASSSGSSRCDAAPRLRWCSMLRSNQM